MTNSMEALPLWFYLAGSACFLIGTVILIFRTYQG